MNYFLAYLDVIELDFVGNFLHVLLDHLGLVLILKSKGEVLNDLVLLFVLGLLRLAIVLSLRWHFT
jgi:hypothetical protein